mmetsp:Transcript_116397/g.228375  ORF Transcript_116397/g.228375 Transcript_116397/m.228375 type:complete len:261 (-) Transcript_116397:324-1106(-)
MSVRLEHSILDVRPADAFRGLLAVRGTSRCVGSWRGGFHVSVNNHVAVEEVGDKVACLDLRRALAAGPGAHEGLAHRRHHDGRAAQRRPLLVALVQLVTPLPDALTRRQALREVLLQAVLHAHEGRLALGVALGLRLRLGASPVRGRDGDATVFDRGDVGGENVLVARGLEVPKHAPSDVRARGVGRRPRGPAEGMRHTQQHELHLRDVPTLAAAQRHAWEGAAARRVRQAEVLERVHVRATARRGAARSGVGASVLVFG